MIDVERNLALAAATHRWVSPQQLAKLYVDYDHAYRALRRYFDEVYILQTCHRVEYYLYSESEISENKVQLALRELYRPDDHKVTHFRVMRGVEVIRHLLRVASGLDSVVLGETDVLGQVEFAYQKAILAGALRSVLRSLVEYSIRFGKHVRTVTGISRGVTGFGSLTIRLLKKLYGDLSTIKVLVVGAGEMGASIVKELRDEGAREIVILNRTLEKARELASRYGCRYDVLTTETLLRYLEKVDVALFAVSTSSPILEREHVRKLRKRPLIVDLSVPPSVNVQGETAVIGFEDLCKLAEKYNREKVEEARKVELMLEEEINKVLEVLNVRFLSKMIGLYMRFAEEIKREELNRALSRGLVDPDTLRRIDVVVSSIVKKTLRPFLRAVQDIAKVSPVEAYSLLRRVLDSMNIEFGEVMRKVAAD